MQYFCKRVSTTIQNFTTALGTYQLRNLVFLIESESYTFHCLTVSRYLIKSVKVFWNLKFNVRFPIKRNITWFNTNKLPSTKTLWWGEYSKHILITLPRFYRQKNYLLADMGLFFASSHTQMNTVENIN